MATTDDLLKSLSETCTEIVEAQSYTASKINTIDSKIREIDEVRESSKNASNINSGTLDKLYGGTSRNDGVATDVYIDENTTAKDIGQLGQSAYKDGVDVNTLITPGLYFCTGTTVALHYPTGNYYFVKVMRNGNYILQHAYFRKPGMNFVRSSEDGGVSWYGWRPIDYKTTSNINIYISKDGSDNNTGLSSDSPVLTVYAALRIAMGISTTGSLIFHFGPGNWGEVSFYGDSYSAGIISIAPFATDGTSTTDPGNMPEFSMLRLYNGEFSVGNIDCNMYVFNSHVVMNGYKRVSAIWSVQNSLVVSQNGTLSIKYSNYPLVVRIQDGGKFILGDTIFFEENSAKTQFIHCDYRRALVYIGNKFSYSGTFSGETAHVDSEAYLDVFYDKVGISSLPGTGIVGKYGLNGIPTDVVNLTDNQTIGGTKTFNSNPIVKNTAPAIILQQTDITKGTIPSSNQGISIHMLDSAGTATVNRTGLLYNNVNSVGLTGTALYAYQFASGSTSYASMGVFCSADGTKYATAPQLLPNGDNTHSLGISDYRWSQLYAGTATINTSDEREKDNIDALPDAVLDAWGEVNFQQFQFKDAIAEKGEDKARVHSGVIAQRIKEIFEKHNLDPFKYGLLCYDSWKESRETIVDKEAVTEEIKIIDKEAVYDEEGNIISPEEYHTETKVIEPEVSHEEIHPGGDRYSIRYEELYAIEAAYQRRRADMLETKMREFGERLSKLESKI